MVTMTSASLDLNQIAASGQCFTWKRLADGRWAIPAFDRCLFAAQDGAQLTFSCDEDEFHAVWRAYFDLDGGYDELLRTIDPDDAYLTAAAAYGRGIRILRQSLWEVMVCFLISQNNNITRITRSVDALCQSYGAPLPGGVCRAFPSPDALAQAQESDFQAHGLGYRARYLAALSREMRSGGLDAFAQALHRADDREAHALLTGLYGVGNKVADCILLFGLHRMDAFPSDTHIRRILETHYPQGFPRARYAGMLGAVQQYLFYYDLHGGA